jgi:hypothetical protein
MVVADEAKLRPHFQVLLAVKQQPIQFLIGL